MVSTTNPASQVTVSAIGNPASHSSVAAYQQNAPAAWASSATVACRRHSAAYTPSNTTAAADSSSRPANAGPPASSTIAPRPEHAGEASAHREPSATARSRATRVPTNPNTIIGPCTCPTPVAVSDSGASSSTSAAYRPPMRASPPVARSGNRAATVMPDRPVTGASAHRRGLRWPPRASRPGGSGPGPRRLPVRRTVPGRCRRPRRPARPARRR